MNEEQIQAMIAAALSGFAKDTLPVLLTGAFKPFSDQITTVLDTVKGLKAPEVKADPKPEPKADPITGGDPLLNSQLAEMKRVLEEQRKQVTTLTETAKQERELREATEMSKAVGDSLAGFSFATPGARKVAEDLITKQVKRTDAGLVAGENLTVEAFVKDFLPSEHAYLLAPVTTGGGGFVPGQQYGKKTVDIDGITASSTPEEKAAYAAAIKAALPR